MGKKDSLKYRAPSEWFAYDAAALVEKISRARAAVHALTSAPFRQSWLESSWSTERHAEIRGTAVPNVGTEAVPDPASDSHDWIFELTEPGKLSLPLICDVHSRLIRNTGYTASEPGALRRKGQQIFFGTPLQRGAKGGKECRESLGALAAAWTADSRQPLIVKSLALHYHIMSIRPFAEGNGRTARTLETLFRQASGLKGAHFVSMWGYYSAEREAYEEALRASRLAAHDLTPFLEFALTGLTIQCERLYAHVRDRLATAVFENTMTEFFDRLKAGKRQQMAARQIRVLESVLDNPGTSHQKLYDQLSAAYDRLKNPWKAFLRDLHDLIQIGAVEIGAGPDPLVRPRLEWPSSITEDLFFQHYRDEPRSGAALSRAV